MKQPPNTYIEHTNLRPDLRDKDIDQLIADAREHSFLGICIPPFWVKRASRELKGSPIQLVTVIGFPLGYQRTEAKLTEIDLAISDGANELDMVVNVSAFKTGMPWTKIELAKCANRAHQEGKILKVIVETALLDAEELATISKMVSDSGADYIKTSTGFSSRGASVEDIQIMKTNVSSHVGIKASGGIKSLSDLERMVEAGAERIGTSSGVDIMNEYNG